jgi:hypothetical protein
MRAGIMTRARIIMYISTADRACAAIDEGFGALCAFNVGEWRAREPAKNHGRSVCARETVEGIDP